MYKIKNITRGKLLLFDIGVKLDAGDTIDLDAKLPREKIESSVNLKVAEDNELIAILHKDVIAPPVTSMAFDPNIFFEMEKRIREQIVQQMQPAQIAVPQPVVQPSKPSQNAEVADLTAKLSELINKMGTQPNNAVTTTPIAMEEYVEDTDKLREVHAKALRRMTQNAEGHVEAKETTGISDASNRADELEDFLK